MGIFPFPKYCTSIQRKTKMIEIKIIIKNLTVVIPSSNNFELILQKQRWTQCYFENVVLFILLKRKEN
jgi:hypothetical protein